MVTRSFHRVASFPIYINTILTFSLLKSNRLSAFMKCCYFFAFKIKYVDRTICQRSMMRSRLGVSLCMLAYMYSCWVEQVDWPPRKLAECFPGRR